MRGASSCAIPRIPSRASPTMPASGRSTRTTPRCSGAGVMKRLLDEYTAAGQTPRDGAVVAGSAIDPVKIANLHMRAHALEGRLYREVIEEGLAAAGIECALLLERDLFARAAERLELREDALKKASTELGRGVAGGWRAENKAAAVAAWVAMQPARARGRVPGQR